MEVSPHTLLALSVVASSVWCFGCFFGRKRTSVFSLRWFEMREGQLDYWKSQKDRVSDLELPLLTLSVRLCLSRETCVMSTWCFALLLDTRVCVVFCGAVAPEALDCGCGLTYGPALGALEQHVLEEMGQSVLALGLGGGSGVEPQVDRDERGSIRGVDDYPKAVVEGAL